MSDAAVAEFSATTKDLGDKIVGLTLKEAKEDAEKLKAELAEAGATVSIK